MLKYPVKAVTIHSVKGEAKVHEDHVLADKERGTFVVADGFGGPIPGAEAAKRACEAVQEFLNREAGDLDATLPFELRSYFSLAGNVIFNALIHANRKVNLMNKGKNVHEKGGASAVGGFIDGDLLALANIGNCSAYMLREGKSCQLVVPRSYSSLVDPFRETQVEELDVPLMALGMAEDLEPEIVEHRVRPGDWILLHTKGLSSDIRNQLASVQLNENRVNEMARMAESILKSGKYSSNCSLSLIMF